MKNDQHPASNVVALDTLWSTTELCAYLGITRDTLYERREIGTALTAVMERLVDRLVDQLPSLLVGEPRRQDLGDLLGPPATIQVLPNEPVQLALAR